MAITYPTSLDSLTNPTTSNNLDSPSHAGQHSDANDILEALEAKVGVDGSADTNSLDYKVENTLLKLDQTTPQTVINGTPTFSNGLIVGDAGTIGLGTGKALIQFDDEATDYISLMNANVGIGTTSPGTQLEVAGASAIIRVRDTTSYALGVGGVLQLGGVYTGTSSATFGQIAGIKENANDNDYASALNFKTRIHGGALTEQMRISSTGNVGIGTTAPAHALDVSGNMRLNTANPTINFRSSNDGQVASIKMTDSAGSAARLGITDDSGVERLTVLTRATAAQGNVGIGTTAPLAKLVVESAGVVSVNINDSSSSQIPTLNFQQGGTTKAFIEGGVNLSSRMDLGVASSRIMTLINGNVGIGTTSPTNKLDIIGTSSGALTAFPIRFSNTAATLGYIGADITNYNSGAIHLYNNGAVGSVISGNGITSLMGGNVGIGTTAPSGQLHISGTDTSDQVIIENTDAGVASAPDLVLWRNSASPAANDVLGRIDFRGNDSTGGAVNYAYMWGKVIDTTAGTPKGYWSVSTNSEGSDSERLVVNGGNVGIGTTGPTAYLHLKAGTATASTAPIKLTSGTVNTTPEAGAIEFDGTDLWISI